MAGEATSERRVRRVVVVGLLLLAGLAVACGREREERADTVPTTAAAQSEPTSGKSVLEERLKEALPTLSDLPTGFIPEPPSRDEGDSPAPCGLPGPKQSLANAEANFTKGGFGPFVNFSLGAFPKGEAKGMVDRVQAALGQCTSFSTTTNDGTPITFTVSPLSFPKLADQTLALRLAGTSQGITVAIDTIVIRRGDVLALVGNGGLNVDSALTESVARMQAESS